LDLHFSEATADDDECAAIDDILGPPESGWAGGTRDERSERQSVGGQAVRDRRHLLLPALHAVQDRIGWISPGALNYISARLTVPPAEAYGVASFYALLSTTPQPPTVIHVCDDIACLARGAGELCTHIEAEFGAQGTVSPDGSCTWKRSPCLGLCDRAPAAFVQCAGVDRQHFTSAPVNSGAIIGALKSMERRLEARSPHHLIISSPHHVLLKRAGAVDPTSLTAYQASGGYRALAEAVSMGPEAVVAELTASKLTGRGGAAFPTGVKWKAVAEAKALPHYVVCNADESEPGTFKDRVLMEEDTFAVIESLTIAGFACGAQKGYLYIRGEYPEATRRLQNAIDELRQASLLGENVMSAGFSFDIEIRRGGGAYICGEETAMLESIEGKRGEPRNKPPFPVHVGLFGKPTVINNVETLVNVLPVLEDGGQQYSTVGTQNSTGTRLFCLSGCVARPGVYEAPYGMTLGEALAAAGGVSNGRSLQAILMGGAAGVFVRPDELDMPLTLEGARAASATLGSGVILVFDNTVDMKAILARIAAFFRDESCGQCVPCRVGTVRQEEALQRLLSGCGGRQQELALLVDLEKAMKDASICGLGHTAASAIQSAIYRLGMFQGGAA